MWQDRRSSWKKQKGDARSAGDVDYARIIHSASFRRLQGKTQILNLGDSDFYRTRLTHSLEVAQIAAGIVRQFRQDYRSHPSFKYIPDDTLIQAIGFTHDLGHPPFGHGGEVALNYCARRFGGFEGNGQTLRILSRLEKMSAIHGSDLCRRTLLGVLKYPAPYGSVFNQDRSPALINGTSVVNMIDREISKPPKCYLDTENDVVDWVLEPLSSSDRVEFQKISTKVGSHGSTIHKSFDCSIMDVSDDIAYGVHDLEDVIALSLVNEDQFREDITEDVCKSFLDYLSERYPGEFSNDIYSDFIRRLFGSGNSRKQFIGRLVGYFITNVKINEFDQFEEPLIRFRADLPENHKRLMKSLKMFVYNRVIRSAKVQHLEYKGQNMVVSVYDVIASDPKAYLPEDAYKRYVESCDGDRAICDHIAGMTDSFLMRTYDRLFSPRMGSVFDKL